MDIRYSCNQRDFKRYTTDEVARRVPDHRPVQGGRGGRRVQPRGPHGHAGLHAGARSRSPSTRASTSGPTSAPITSWSAARSACSTSVRAPARSRPTASAYHMNRKDCLYIAQGTKDGAPCTSDDPEQPATFLHGLRPGPLPVRDHASSPSRRPPSARWAAWKAATSAPSTSSSTPACSRPASCPWA